MTARPRWFSLTAFLLFLVSLPAPAASQESGSDAATRAAEEANADDADLPPFARGLIDKETYLKARAAHFATLRGLPYNWSAGNPRLKAIQQMRKRQSMLGPLSGAMWNPIGPAPIPNGQTTTIPTAVSGRTISIAVHPTNPSIVYAGTANGGIYRTLDGGVSWTPIFDEGASLAIGALALAPSNPTILYVGTGEPSGSCDSYFGIGLYRIDNADTDPILNGPFNPAVTTGLPGTTAFTGRSISRILVHPTDPATIFVATHSGIGGLGCDAFSATVPPLALRGLYRSTNGTSASPAFQKLTVTTAASIAPDVSGNRSVIDMAFDPASPSTLVCWVYGTIAAGDGGVYRSLNALAPVPTFLQELPTTVDFARGELAAVGTTMVLATGETAAGTSCTTGNGALRRSVSGGPWSAKLAGGGGFCGGQCFYDIAIAIKPDNPTILLLGGAANGTCSRVLARSTNSGSTFIASDVGLHADTHVLAFAPSAPNVVWVGSDGGIYKSTDAGLNWTSMNTIQFNATQFQSLAVHPTDLNFTIGGTQDNGTNFYRPTGTWIRADFGDGGYAQIDQNATDVSSVTMYHTYFSQTNNFIGFSRVTNVACATEGQWVVRGTFADPTLGCEGVPLGIINGISVSDVTQFYAPLVLGPGSPNTVYFGTDRLYRSTNRGDVMTVVSQAPIVASVPISTIAIAPTNDNVRLVGLHAGGRIFGTTTGAAVLTDITAPGMPAGHVGRLMIDPTNPLRAYAAFGGYGVPAGQHVWRTNDLTLGAAGWVPAGNGLPDVPVNALVIDRAFPNTVYAGTDIGVYETTDAGATWAPYGTGLPVVPVFDMAIQYPSRFLRIATHGRGMWHLHLPGSAVDVETPTASFVGAEFQPGRVMLSWNTTLDGSAPVTIYRRAIPGDWIRLGSATPTSRGTIEFEDTSARAGGRYVYALGTGSGAGERFVGEVTLTVPTGSLALAVGPNPSQGKVTATFTLAYATPATLELLDITGRRLEQHQVGSLGAGEHRVEFRAAPSLEPGVYWAKLSQDGNSTTRRFILAH
jgi:photosystem II stability/assembly factor-like uncharacterized protein